MAAENFERLLRRVFVVHSSAIPQLRTNLRPCKLLFERQTTRGRCWPTGNWDKAFMMADKMGVLLRGSLGQEPLGGASLDHLVQSLTFSSFSCCTNRLFQRRCVCTPINFVLGVNSFFFHLPQSCCSFYTPYLHVTTAF